MSSSHIVVVSVASLALLVGCESGDALSSEELEASVASMTRSDVTWSPDEGVGAREVVDRSQGYATALRSAILENQEFAASVRRYRSAAARIRVAQSGTRPQITSNATAGGIFEGGDISGTSTGAAGEINLSQLIYDGGQTRANIAGATAQAFAARANIAVAGNEVGRNAARAWIDLWEADAQIVLVEERLNEIGPFLDRLERLVANGIVNRALLAAAERQFLDLKLEEEDLQAALRDAQERFNRYYGERPRSIPAPQRLFSDTELAQTANTWPDSPALIAAAGELIAAERAVDAAQAEMRPTVSLRTGGNSPLGQAEEPDFNVGVVLQYTLGDGGRRKAEIERLEEQLEAGRATFEDTKSATRVEVETSLSRHRALRSNIPILEEQIRQLDVERSTLRSQITSGQSDFRRLIEAEILYYRARARLIGVRGLLAVLEITMTSTTGQLVDKLGININAIP
jgi:outer membrane protein TolC